MSSWELENVEQAAAANPLSFFIPSAAERDTQQVGDVVRLHFVLLQEGADLPRAERMWVEIAERSGDPPRYIGVLTNQPRSIQSLAPGDRIPFGPEHIARISIKHTDPRWFEAAEKSAIVSQMVFDEGESVLWMYREPADREDDSGWRLFTGRETPDTSTTRPTAASATSRGSLIAIRRWPRPFEQQSVRHSSGLREKPRGARYSTGIHQRID